MHALRTHVTLRAGVTLDTLRTGVAGVTFHTLLPRVAELALRALRTNWAELALLTLCALRTNRPELALLALRSWRSRWALLSNRRLEIRAAHDVEATVPARHVVPATEAGTVHACRAFELGVGCAIRPEANRRQAKRRDDAVRIRLIWGCPTDC